MFACIHIHTKYIYVYIYVHMHPWLHMCIYIYASTHACDVWKCTGGFYYADVFIASLQLMLSCRCSWVTFFLSYKKGNCEAHCWKSYILMLDLGY